MIRKKSKYDIEFVSTIEGMSLVKEGLPAPAREFIPDWWKNLNTRKSTVSSEKIGPGNVKNCPSFPDYFSSGYIVPMWADTLLTYNSETGEAGSSTSHDKFEVTIHGQNQYLAHVNHTFFGQKSYMVFKLIAPWKMITPPGYSVYQLPTMYHFNQDVSVLPGVIDTDIHHDMNIQLVIHSDKKDIFIPRGTPLAQYIPFKREKTNFSVRDANEEDFKKIKKVEMEFITKFNGSKVYNKMRKERDKK